VQFGNRLFNISQARKCREDRPSALKFSSIMGAVKSHCPKTRRATGCVFYIASLTLLGISVPIFFESWPHLQIATVLKLCGR
jgi:hypothetical protein